MQVEMISKKSLKKVKNMSPLYKLDWIEANLTPQDWKGDPSGSLSGTKQGDELFQEFGDRLLKVAGRIFGSPEARASFVTQLAYVNANATCCGPEPDKQSSPNGIVAVLPTKRIAQLVLVPLYPLPFKFVKSKRGQGGFGSSDVSGPIYYY
jgi:hypothetical protein